MNRENSTIKTTIISLILILCIGAIAPAYGQGGGEYRENEFNVSGFLGDVDKEDSDFLGGISASYFFTRCLGVGAVTHWEETDGSFLDNLSAEGYYRWPLEFWSLAPYGLVSLGYSFETDEVFAGIGGGAEWRFSPHWGLFGDVRYQFNDDTDDGVGYRFGVRFTF